MKVSRWRITTVSIVCIFLSPFAVAEEILLAKVYRDYPGYIESPTCTNPRLTSSHVQPLARVAVRGQQAETVAVAEPEASRRAGKIYRDYPGYIEVPTCINPRMAPTYAVQPGAEDSTAEKLAAEKLATEKLAAEKLATEKLATEKLATEKLATEKLAAEKLTAEKLAAEKLTAEKLAAEKHNDPVVSQGAASILSDVRIAPGQVVLESNGKIAKYRYFTLNNPPRLVVDIYELEPSFEERSFSTSDGFNNLRIGTHSDKTRLVFDAQGAELPQYTVEENSTDIRISWDKIKSGEIAEVMPVVTAEKLAAEKLAAGKLAAGKLAAEKLAAEKLAAEKLAAEKLAAEKLAAEKLAAEKLPALPFLRGDTGGN